MSLRQPVLRSTRSCSRALSPTLCGSDGGFTSEVLRTAMVLTTGSGPKAHVFPTVLCSSPACCDHKWTWLFRKDSMWESNKQRGLQDLQPLLQSLWNACICSSCPVGHSRGSSATYTLWLPARPTQCRAAAPVEVSRLGGHSTELAADGHFQQSSSSW